MDIQPSSDPNFDFHGASFAVLEALGDPELTIEALSWITAPNHWQKLESLEAAKASAYGVAILASFGTTNPFVVAPASSLGCDEEALKNLAADLLEARPAETEELGHSYVRFFNIQVGERIYRMNGTDSEGLPGPAWFDHPSAHMRWSQTLWVSKRYQGRLRSQIEFVLAGQLDRIQFSPALARRWHSFLRAHEKTELWRA
jgi:hypothetical protein